MTRPLARLAQLLPVAGIVGLTAVVACSDEAGAPPPAPSPSPAETADAMPPSGSLPQGVEALGQFEGHFDAKTKKLTFRKRAAAPSLGTLPGAEPQGFVQLGTGTLDLVTESAIIGPDPGFNGGEGCAADTLCAIVTVTNSESGRKINSAFVQITDASPAGFVGQNSVAVPTGYPLDNSLGLWSYGDLDIASGGPARWDFTLPSDEDFTFNVTLFGTFLRTSYNSQGTSILAAQNTLDNTGTFRNACASPIVQVPGSPFLVGAAAGTSDISNPIALPFPFTLYDVTFDTDSNPYFFLSTNGAIGFGAPEGDANVTLPDSSGAYDYMLFPFWDSITPGPGGVCVGVEGTAPTRKLVVTWLGATLTGTQNLTFSAVLNERTDVVQFQYHRYSNLSASNCTSSALTQGNSATIGVQGPGGVGSKLIGFNTTSLPAHNLVCPGSGYQYSLLPSPGNN